MTYRAAAPYEDEKRETESLQGLHELLSNIRALSTRSDVVKKLAMPIYSIYSHVVLHSKINDDF
jgi:hypothetical protein